LVQLLHQLLLEANIAPLAQEMTADAGERRCQDLPHPGQKLSLRVAAKLVEAPMGLQKGFLDDIGGIDFARQPALELHLSQ
jgi:hypothetical protein